MRRKTCSTLNSFFVLLAATTVLVTGSASAEVPPETPHEPPTVDRPQEGVSTPEPAPASVATPVDKAAAVEKRADVEEEPEKKPDGWLRRQHDKETGRASIDKSHTPVLGLSGPRFGAYYLHTDEVGTAMMRSAGVKVPFFMFLGYQFEWAWLATSAGTAGLVEVVPVVSGFEHGRLLPSANVLVGLRTARGIGLAMGVQAGLGMAPVLGPCGTLLCDAELETRTFVAGVAVVGFAIPAGELIIPIDVVFSFDQQSARVGLATGFSGFL